MTRFFIRVLASLGIGWWIGVEMGLRLWPQSNLGPMVAIMVAVPVTYLASLPIVPLLRRWLGGLR
jgi:hypothetical protein